MLLIDSLSLTIEQQQWNHGGGGHKDGAFAGARHCPEMIEVPCRVCSLATAPPTATARINPPLFHKHASLVMFVGLHVKAFQPFRSLRQLFLQFFLVFLLRLRLRDSIGVGGLS